LASRARLLSTKGPDAAIWRRAFEALPAERRDVFLLPEYAAVHERDSQVARAFLAEQDGACVLYPFILRPVRIDGRPALFRGRPARDVATPYGFGGPVASADIPGLYSAFSLAFASWCLEEEVASEFMCLHPFTGSAALVGDDGAYSHAAGKPMVFIDLDGGDGNIWRQLNRGHRSAVNHARKHGVVVEKVVPGAADYETFNRLYASTMDRHGAAERWYHPADYFRRCQETLGPEHCSFFVARVNGAVAAWFIVLHGQATAYYHFAGSDLDLSPTKASQLLMHEVSLWCRKQGFRRFFLGGGISAEADDKLLSYKLGFSKNTIPHVTAWRIHHAAAYEELVRQKTTAEAASPGPVPAREYFPAYRR